MASPDAELKVRIDAELAAGFLTAFKTGSKIPKEFADKVDAELKRAAAAAKKLGDNLGGGLAKGSNQAAFALTNLGRVAQDAPFGFIGIQNNLNPLLESFQQLKKESGSTAGALKAMVGSLTGAAGLGLALSLVSSAVLFYTQYLQGAKRETKEVTEASDDFAKSLNAVSQAQLKGAQDAQKEITTLKTLYTASQNDALSREKRIDAVDAMQQKYPAVFKNFTDEAILAGRAGAAYDLLSKSIIATARARASEELIGEKSKEQLLNIEKIAGLEAKVSAERIRTAKEEKKIQQFKTPGLFEDAASVQQQAVGLQKYAESRVAAEKQIVDLKAKNKSLTDEMLKLERNITAEIQKGADLSGKVGDVAKPDKKLETTRKQLDEITERAKFAGGELENLYGQRTVDLGVTALTEPFKQLGIVSKQVGEQAKKTGIEILTPFQNILATTLPQLQSGFENFFNDILEKGKFSFAALGQAILKTFASVLASQVTTQLLNLVANAANIGGSTKGGGGAAQNVAGAAASAIPLLAGGTAATGGLLLPILGGIAAAGLIASLFKKKKQDPYLTPAAVATSSASNVGAASFSGGSVVFEISGVNLIGVLNRAGARLQRYNIGG